MLIDEIYLHLGEAWALEYTHEVRTSSEGVGGSTAFQKYCTTNPLRGHLMPPG